MCVAVNSDALPAYKKNRIASLLCIFETTVRRPIMTFVYGNSNLWPLKIYNGQSYPYCIYLHGENLILDHYHAEFQMQQTTYQILDFYQYTINLMLPKNKFMSY